MSANSQVARNQSRQTIDSVYESTNPITTIAGQRMTEWFTGNSLNTDRWTYKAGTGGVVTSQGMADEVNGGYSLIMTNGHIGTYDFANVRQYNYDGAGIIGVCKRDVSTGRMGIGFVGDDTDSGNGGLYMNRRTTRLIIYNGTTDIYGLTSDSSGETSSATGVASDGNFHNLKIGLSGTATTFSVDGILKSTVTTTLTDEKVQPMFMAWNDGGGGGNINYLEAYNT